MSRPEFLVDGQKLNADITGRITTATHVRTMDGASSLELALDDNDFAVIGGGLLTKPGKPTGRQARLQNFDQAAWARFGQSRLTYGGWFTRLAGVDGNYDASGGSLTLTFEDEIAALMRLQEKAIKSSRGGQTRAQFIGMLLGIARKRVGFERFYSPEENVRQHVKKPDTRNVAKGFTNAEVRKLTIKGAKVDGGQRHNLEIALGVADDLAAGKTATLAMLCAGIGESEWVDKMNGNQVPVETWKRDPAAYGATSGYGGVLQGAVLVIPTPNWFRPMGSAQRTREEAKSFLQGGRGFQAGGAIKAARANPDWTPGKIGTSVEGSGEDGSFYQQWISEAQAILDAWGGSDSVQITAERYEYRAGGKRNNAQHNYWDDAGDLAREVQWRLFADANTLYYVSDEWLFGRQPVFTLDQGVLSAGVLGVQFTADIGMPVAEVIVTGRVHDWDGAPGAVVQVDDLGPLTGRWLIWRHERDLLLGQSTMTLHRPAPKKAEPAHGIHTKTVSTGSVDPTQVTVDDMHGTPKDLIDNLVLPLARQHGLKTPSGLPLTPDNNDAANAAHTHLGSASDHAGPPNLKWAADCTNSTHPTPEMDAFAKDIQTIFGLSGWKGAVITGYRAAYRIQLIYRYSDPQAGNHFNHVHVGIAVAPQ